jgi:hypothetical protein
MQTQAAIDRLKMRKRTGARKDFAVCINNRDYEASLEAGKLYRIVPDTQAEGHGYLRVVDESGEDYGYSAERFYRIEVPGALAEVLASGRSERAIRKQTGSTK